MAVTAYWFSNGIWNLGQSVPSALHESSTLYCALSTTAPNQQTFDFFDDVTEITGTGYTTHGKAMTGVTWAVSALTCTLNADDCSWTSASFTARYAIVYELKGGAHSADPLLLYYDFGSEQTVVSGTFTIVWNASGLATIVVS